MAYPYDREFFEPTYQPTPLAPSIGWSGDFYGIPQPTDHITHPETLASGRHKTQRIHTYRAYNGWRPAASNSAEWRPAPWQQIEPVPNHYVGLPESKPRIVQPIESVVSKPFRCQICGKAFSQAANLTAHNRVHTGEKPFECPVCNRPFSQSSSLVTHRRTHSGERPYPCKHCDKAFTDSSTLTKHLRTHTGQKPYGCPLCSMRFTQSGNLHRHMKTHKH